QRSVHSRKGGQSLRSKRCPQCRSMFKPRGRGRPPRFCSAACRQKAYRKRAADPRRPALKLYQSWLHKIVDRPARFTAALKVLEDEGVIGRGHLSKRAKPTLKLVPRTSSD